MRTARHILYYLVMALIVVQVINIASCKSKATSTPSKSLPDTSRVIGVFVDLKGEDIRHDIVYRVIKDSIKVDTSNVMRNIVTKDSLYFIPIVDSARDRQTGKPSFDSLGKAIFTTYWIPTQRSMVIDLGLKVDSAVSKLGKYLKQPIKNP